MMTILRPLYRLKWAVKEKAAKLWFRWFLFRLHHHGYWLWYLVPFKKWVITKLHERIFNYPVGQNVTFNAYWVKYYWQLSKLYKKHEPQAKTPTGP